MTKFILDCSVTMSWCFEDESSTYSDAVLHSLEKNTAFVPWLWDLEVCNVLLIAQKRGRITDNRIFNFLALLAELNIVTDNTKSAIQDLILIGQKYSLTGYDSAYLHLCLTHAMPIATLNKRLIDAVTFSGGAVYRP
jgi:predicted nucleic acid-binding protein